MSAAENHIHQVAILEATQLCNIFCQRGFSGPYRDEGILECRVHHGSAQSLRPDSLVSGYNLENSTGVQEGDGDVCGQRPHAGQRRRQCFPVVTVLRWALPGPHLGVCAARSGLWGLWPHTRRAGAACTVRPALPGPKRVPAPTHPCGSQNLRPELKGIFGLSDVKTDYMSR